MIDFDELSDAWPSILVARSEIGNFTRGLYKSSTFNTYDGAKMGIRRKIRINTKIAYLKTDVIEWLKNKVKK